MKKYKFILTLPYEIEVDSEEIDGHMSWPNYSQADPVVYRGIFDSYEEAQAYASKFEIYKYVLTNIDYDSFESEDLEPFYYLSIFDAEDAACRDLNIEPGDYYIVFPDDYTIEEYEVENEIGDYKYRLYYNGECVFDSVENYDEYFITYGDAEMAAQQAMEDFEIEIEPPYELLPVEIVDFRVEEIEIDEEVEEIESLDEEEIIADEEVEEVVYDFEIKNGELLKYRGDDSIVTIPDGVTSIGDCAFYQCKNIETIVIPNSVTSIGNRAFWCCEKLNTIEIPDSVTSIGNSAFEFCGSLTSVKIPDKVTVIKQYMFKECKSLVSVILSDNVTSIDTFAFAGCENLFDIKLPSRLKTIGSNAFDLCSSITKIEIPNGVTEIPWHAFGRCFGALEIVLPNSVKTIGVSAFGNCLKVKKINIPSSVTSIAKDAFYRCLDVESIIVDKDNTVYHSENNCLIETESKKLILGCKTSVIPKDGSVTSIGANAFKECISLTSINIPDSVTLIGEAAFEDCKNLKNVNIPYGVTEIRINTFCRCKKLKSVEIPDGVTAIYGGAFHFCTSLQSMTIPASVTKIGDGCGVFSGCDDLVIYAPKGSYAEKYAKKEEIKFKFS